MHAKTFYRVCPIQAVLRTCILQITGANGLQPKHLAAGLSRSLQRASKCECALLSKEMRAPKRSRSTQMRHRLISELMDTFCVAGTVEQA
eukprot:1144133-Pelagomonas_calceolata.AAC.3